MTTTLLKHEWLRTRGALGMYFGITVLVGLLGSLLGASGWSVLSVLGLLLAFLAVFVLVPGVQLLLVADYWRSGYGRTGYFTQSIPVRGATIFRAKLLWAVLVSLAAVVLTVLLGWVVWWAVAINSGITSPSVAVIGDIMADLAEIAPAWMIVAGAVLMLASFLVWPIYYYFAVSVGHENRFAGMGAAGPIVVFVVLYVGMQLASLLGMVAIPLGIGMEGDRLGLVSFNVLDEMTVGTANSEAMPIGFLATMGLILVFCAWRTVRSWNHKVALR